jgi:hypothetical protein
MNMKDGKLFFEYADAPRHPTINRLAVLDRTEHTHIIISICVDLDNSTPRFVVIMDGQEHEIKSLDRLNEAILYYERWNRIAKAVEG